MKKRRSGIDKVGKAEEDSNAFKIVGVSCGCG